MSEGKGDARLRDGWDDGPVAPDNIEVKMFAKRRKPGRVRELRLGLERSLGLDDEMPACEVIETLHRWALGLPFVVELAPMPAGDAGRRYAIDCPPLECRSVWLWTGPIDEFETVFELNVVLPHGLARRGAAQGWAVPVAELDADRWVAAVPMPTCPAELRALQALLRLAYEAAFRASRAQTTS